MKPIVTADTAGIITDVRAGMLYLFKCFISSEASQSNLYRDAVSSLPALIKQNPNDPQGLSAAAGRGLQALYGAHFDAPNVNTSIKNTAVDGTDTRYNLQMSVEVIENGQTYHLSNVLTDAYLSADSLLKRISGDNA